jgi:hypothetical protein
VKPQREKPVRSYLAKIIVGLVVALCWLPYGIQAGASSNRSDQPITKDNAAQILAVTLRTAASEGSCSDFTSSVTAGESFGDLTNSEATEGEQFITYDGATVDIRLLDSVLYVKANNDGVLAWYGVKDRAVATKWIEVPESSADYTSFQNAITLTSMLKEISPTGSLKVTPVREVDSHRVIGVLGQPNSHLGFSNGTETLYVSTSFPYVPVELIVAGVTTGSVKIFRMTFTNWGSHIEVVKPGSYTSIFNTTLSKNKHVTLR